MSGLRWERIATVRTVLLIVIGSASFVVAAWGWDWRAGVAVLGIACFFLEFMTGERPNEQARS